MKSVIRLDVGPLQPDGEANQVAIEFHIPAQRAPDARLLFCIPGGGMSRRYYDLDGGDGTDFSFATAMAREGHVVALLDPVGVGESTQPENGFALTSAIEAEFNHRAFTALRTMDVEGLALGSLPALGVGHSAGALLAILQQSRFSDFDAMLLIGFGSDGLPQFLPPTYVTDAADPDFDRQRIVEMAREMFGGEGYMATVERPPDTPAARALATAYAATITPVGMHAMTPGNVRREMGDIDCPVFLALGGRDMTGPAHLIGSDYSRCPDFTRYVIEDAGHHLFVVPQAPFLYSRVARWARGMERRVGN